MSTLYKIPLLEYKLSDRLDFDVICASSELIQSGAGPWEPQTAEPVKLYFIGVGPFADSLLNQRVQLLK